MPHHSKRAQRHHHLDGAGAYAPTSSGNLRSQQSFPPQEARSTMNYMNRTSVVSESSASCQNVGVHRLQYRPGDVQLQTTSSHTHWNGTKNSLVESVSSYDQVSPSSPESTCSKKVFGTSDLALSKDDSDVATIVRSPSREIASVLLLSLAATSGKTLTMPDASSSLKAETDRAHLSACNDESERTHSTGNKSSYPLKKRKVMEDVALKESDNGLDHTDGVCHISPISHGSKSSRVSDTAPEVDGQSFSGNDSISRTSVAQSYQFKEDSSTKTVDELKRGDSGRILPSNVMIPHFPEALHWLLTESSTQSVSAASSSEFIVDHSVMQWVTHGQAFRIIRWDSFHRNVLPAYFPQLSIEIDGRSVTAGSLDTFMWHLNAWGFEEIKDGPDVGAFAHTVSRSSLFLVHQKSLLN